MLDRRCARTCAAELSPRCAELTFGNGGAEAAAWLSGLPARRCARTGG